MVWAVIKSFFRPIKYAARANPPIITPPIPILIPRSSENNPALGSLGFCSITPSSAGSTPRDSAGKVSVTKLTHNMCIGIKGSAHPNNVAKNRVIISPILQDSKK